MTKAFFLKVFLIHLIALKLVYASPSSWAFQQVETEKAWELARGRGDQVTIAVIDTGADLKHPTLQSSIWKNLGEVGLDSTGQDKSKNGIDDDRNGYIDDVHGWNFVTNSNQVLDSHGHGTHIAGIIASIAPKSHLMILKYYDSKSSNEQNVRNAMKAFRYAIQMKVQIMNFSGGGPGFQPEEFKILKQAEQKNILLIAAAGNDGINTDLIPYFPADYPLSNILSVTACDQRNKLPYFGNYGKTSVHIAAPGNDILSAAPFGKFTEMSGTSQATAFATGAAALLLSQSPLLQSPSVIIQKILAGSTPEKFLEGKTIRGSRLQISNALKLKSSLESAAGFVFENSAELDPALYMISGSSLDQSPPLGQVERLRKAASE